MQKTIFIKTNFVGWHKWDKSPQKTLYLRSLHRHLFNIVVEVEVLHNDREIEFHSFKNEIEQLLVLNINKKNTGSCEMIGEKLLKILIKEYQGRYIMISIDEDGENGAKINNLNNYESTRKN